MVNIWSAVIGIVPALIAAVISVFGEGAHGKQLGRIQRQTDVLTTSGLPTQAQERLEELVTREVGQYAAAVDRRDGRKLDGGSIAALVVVTAVGGLLGWGVVELLILAWPVWYWVTGAFVVAIIVFGFTIGLAIAGITQIWNYPDES